MKRLKFYICALLFLALTGVKMIAPAAAADMRAALLPAISADDDYHSVLAAVGPAPQPERAAADAAPYTVTPPLDALRQELESLHPDFFAGLPEAPLPPEPAETAAPELSEAMQAAYAAREVFLQSQADYADYTLPANVSYDVLELPFADTSPVAGYTSSGFGYRMHPIQGVVKFHYGTDFAASAGTDVLAFADGTVLAAGQDAGYGNYVKIDHGNGYVTLYGHCSELLVSAGQTVQRGERIALVGATGQATGPHLHVERMHDGVYLNPEFYLAV